MKKKRKKKPECSCMQHVHTVHLDTLEALQLVSAATHAVQNGYDDHVVSLESAVNSVLQHCNIDCEWDDEGTMVLTYKGPLEEQCSC
jgi:hypothetical protein